MKHAADGLNRIMADLLRRAPDGDAALMAWPLVCGPGVAARTRALGFSEGVLRVEVPDRAWRAQLCELVARYLAEINDIVPYPVEKIVFTLPGEVLCQGSSNP